MQAREVAVDWKGTHMVPERMAVQGLEVERRLEVLGVSNCGRCGRACHGLLHLATEVQEEQQAIQLV